MTTRVGARADELAEMGDDGPVTPAPEQRTRLSPSDRDGDRPGARDPAGLGEVRTALAAAVAAIGGTERPGQVRMAEQVAEAFAASRHLLVQAGTGTGKSLAYLVPALLHSLDSEDPVVVATATLALQSQLVDRDLPRLVDALTPLLHRRPRYAILKGRRNYLCLQRLHDGPPDDAGGVLFAAPTTPLGREVKRIVEWSATTKTGDRDELVPGVSNRAWGQYSVSAGECLGATRCPFGEECYAEAARARAAESDLIVTNHALLAVAALQDIPVLPEHEVVIVDEAHELADRVTSVATLELTATLAGRAARLARGQGVTEPSRRLDDAADALAGALAQVEPGRLDAIPPELADAVAGVRDAARAVLSGLTEAARGKGSGQDAGQGAGAGSGTDAGSLAGLRQAADVGQAVFDVAARVARHDEHDVAWVSDDERRGRVLYIAPLSVSGLIRDALFGKHTVVLTSATLALGGSFEPIGTSVGLGPPDQVPRWRGIDVGSPFDYPRQGMLYVAAHLPRPGREALAPETLDELAALVEAAGGRTLGLFSSMRAAREATDALRDRLEVPLLCQGEDTTAELVRLFAADPRTCLFGTLSLWQGVDVPGPSLQLVVIDRLPFPRPDDPLLSARQRAVERAGGNGFLTVSATHAALRLAQGAGRLIRASDDRGVVAVLDPRLATARYGQFLRRSMPPLWATTDPEVVRRGLRALDVAGA